MTSLMFDSDDPGLLGTIQFVPARLATYADLLTPAIVAEYGGRLAVIDRGLGDPLGRAHIVDIEPEAHSVQSGAATIKAWHAEGRHYLTVYVNRGNWAEVLQACLPVRPYEWVATLDGTLNPNGKFPHLTQFAGEQQLGLHADVSVVWDEGWLPQPRPVTDASLAVVRDAMATVSTSVVRLSSVVGQL